MSILIKKAHLLDPSTGVDGIYDCLIDKKKIQKIAKDIKDDNAKVIDGKGKYLFPGLVDLHVHFREPGFEYKETIESGIAAARKGGFVACVSMPNTSPASDNECVIELIKQRAKAQDFSIFPSGTITKGRNGKELAPLAELKRSGCPAVTDDGDSVSDPLLLRRAMEYAKMHDLVVMIHAEEHALSKNGCMNEGRVATRMGLRGIPNAAEDVIVARDIELARLTGAKVHFQHVSTKRSVELIRDAKKSGLSVTGEATPHHIALSDECITDYDSNKKMNPPLRSPEDRKAVVSAVKKGILDIIATDHAPHADVEKDVEFDKAPFGIIGLETALAISLTELYHKAKMPLSDIVERMSVKPQEIIGISGFAEIREGSIANLCLVDVDEEWTVSKADLRSKSSNSPFLGAKLKGRVYGTISNGKYYD